MASILRISRLSPGLALRSPRLLLSKSAIRSTPGPRLPIYRLAHEQAFATMAPTIPQTMKAVRIHKTGGIDVLDYETDVPVPVPGDGQVLVRNEFVGINYIDTYFRTGLYPLPSTPFTPGREASGTIVSLGPNVPPDLQQGTRVVFAGAGSYAEYTAADARYTVPVPDPIDAKTAAAAALQGLTALTLVRDAHPVRQGDWVLVTAAAGGVGLWLIQILRKLGARTIAVASSAEKRELVRGLGAEVVLEYLEEAAFVERVLEVTGGEGVAVAFDSVGKATFDRVLKVVARKGSLVSFGNASGAVEGFALGRLAAKNVKLVRPTLFNYLYTREEFRAYADDLWDLISKDGLKVHIHGVYPLEDVRTATRDIESRGTVGKLLLKP